MSNEINIVVIGAGTGGNMAANHVYKDMKKTKKSYTVTIIDPTFEHVYQPGFLFTSFGAKTKSIIKDSRKMLNKGVSAVMDKVNLVDTENKIVKTDKSGEFPYDYLVLATGARMATETVEWWSDDIYEFYTPKGAEKLYAALEKFEGGKVVVSIADLPYKCPPAPVEMSMLLDDYFKKRGIRDKVDIIYTSPLNRPFSIETTSTRVEGYLNDKNIDVRLLFNTDYVYADEEEGYAVESMEGEEVEYDLLIMVPPHRGQQFIIDSGIAKGQGWIPTNKETLEVIDQENMFALGDCTDIPTSKAGSTAHYQSPVVGKNIAHKVMGKELALYDGHVQCFFLTEFGKSMFINFNYKIPPPPSPTRKFWWWFKLAFKPLYYTFLVPGRFHKTIEFFNIKVKDWQKS
jgi:sulfide:quinone oxidoreductase